MTSGEDISDIRLPELVRARIVEAVATATGDALERTRAKLGSA